MSKQTEKPAAATAAPTAPTSLGSADADAPAGKKPTLEARVTALEIRSFGHSPYAEKPAE